MPEFLSSKINTYKKAIVFESQTLKVEEDHPPYNTAEQGLAKATKLYNNHDYIYPVLSAMLDQMKIPRGRTDFGCSSRTRFDLRKKTLSKYSIESGLSKSCKFYATNRKKQFFVWATRIKLLHQKRSCDAELILIIVIHTFLVKCGSILNLMFCPPVELSLLILAALNKTKHKSVEWPQKVQQREAKAQFQDRKTANFIALKPRPVQTDMLPYFLKVCCHVQREPFSKDFEKAFKLAQQQNSPMTKIKIMRQWY